MLFMNSYEIDVAEQRYADHPVLGPATKQLAELADWTNNNSDGWAYWPKPCRAAKKLQELIQYADRFVREFGGPPDHVGDAYKRALVPIKAFRTRQGADFQLYEVQ